MNVFELTQFSFQGGFLKHWGTLTAARMRGSRLLCYGLGERGLRRRRFLCKPRRTWLEAVTPSFVFPGICQSFAFGMRPAECEFAVFGYGVPEFWLIVIIGRCVATTTTFYQGEPKF